MPFCLGFKKLSSTQVYLVAGVPIVCIFSAAAVKCPGFIQKTRPKNQGLFKDFPAPNNFIPGPFYFH